MSKTPVPTKKRVFHRCWRCNSPRSASWIIPSDEKTRQELRRDRPEKKADEEPEICQECERNERMWRCVSWVEHKQLHVDRLAETCQHLLTKFASPAIGVDDARLDALEKRLATMERLEPLAATEMRLTQRLKAAIATEERLLALEEATLQRAAVEERRVAELEASVLRLGELEKAMTQSVASAKVAELEEATTRRLTEMNAALQGQSDALASLAEKRDSSPSTTEQRIMELDLMNNRRDEEVQRFVMHWYESDRLAKARLAELEAKLADIDSSCEREFQRHNKVLTQLSERRHHAKKRTRDESK